MLETKGITSRVDSVARMVMKKAYGTYNHLPQQHKRWVDQDDLAQDGLLSAWLTETQCKCGHPETQHKVGKRCEGVLRNKGRRRTVPCECTLYDRAFDESKGKYSTLVHQSLDHLNQNKQVHLGRKMRQTGGMVELDRPIQVEDDTVGMDLPSTEVSQGEITQAVSTFRNLIDKLTPQAAMFLGAGLLTGKWSNGRKPTIEKQLTAEITKVVSELGVTDTDLRLISKNKTARDFALNALAEAVIMNQEAGMNQKILQCVECTGMFPLSAVKESQFFPDTMTCGGCYRKLKGLPPEESCFGKVKTDKTEGFDSSDPECRLHCRDRHNCSQFIKEKLDMARKTVDVDQLDDVTELEEVDETDLDETDEVEEAEEEAEEAPVKKAPKAKTKTVKGKTKATAKVATTKTKAPAKKATKATKAGKTYAPVLVDGEWVDYDEFVKKELTEDAPPKNVGPVWPHKNGSLMQYCFKRAYEGVPLTELKDEIESNGSGWPLMLSILRGDENGFHGMHRAHTWKLSEDGGVLKVYNLRYLGQPEKAVKSEKTETKATGKKSSKEAPVAKKAKSVKTEAETPAPVAKKKKAKVAA